MGAIDKMFAWGEKAASGPQKTENVIDYVQKFHPGKHMEPLWKWSHLFKLEDILHDKSIMTEKWQTSITYLRKGNLLFR